MPENGVDVRLAPRLRALVLSLITRPGDDDRYPEGVGPTSSLPVAANRLAGIAVIAGNTLVAEPQAMVEAADKAGLFVVGLPA